MSILPPGVRAAAEDLDLRHRERDGPVAGEIAPERHRARRRGRVRDGERHRHRRVAPEPSLVRRAVERDERGVDARLVERIAPFERLQDRADDVRGRLADVHPSEPRTAVAKIDRLARAARRAGRSHRAPRAAARKPHLGLERRASARIPDAARVDAGDRVAHGAARAHQRRAISPTSVTGSRMQLPRERPHVLLRRDLRQVFDRRLAVDARKHEARQQRRRSRVAARARFPRDMREVRGRERRIGVGVTRAPLGSPGSLQQQVVQHEGKIERRVAVPRALGVEDHGAFGPDQQVLRAEVAVDEHALRAARGFGERDEPRREIGMRARGGAR